MSDMPLRPEDDDDLLAAEYVSGLLDLAERLAVETRARNDVVFAARITDWENRLSDLNDDYAPVPAPNLMPQIEARLFPVAAKRSLWSNLWAWGATAAAALAVLAYLALTPAAPDFTATLQAEDGLRYEAVVTGGQLTITRVAGQAPDAAHSHELWIIAGDNPPVSLGVIPGESEDHFPARRHSGRGSGHHRGTGGRIADGSAHHNPGGRGQADRSLTQTNGLAKGSNPLPARQPRLTAYIKTI